MKTILFICISSVLLINSCAIESPSSFYSFKIVNKTAVFLIVKSMTINEDSIRIDTVRSGQELKREIHLFERYIDYKDTLIFHLFSNLKIKSNEGMVKKDLYNRGNWESHLDIRPGITGKGVIGNLTLVIKQSDLILTSNIQTE